MGESHNGGKSVIFGETAICNIYILIIPSFLSHNCHITMFLKKEDNIMNSVEFKELIWKSSYFTFYSSFTEKNLYSLPRDFDWTNCGTDQTLLLHFNICHVFQESSNR